MQLGYPKQSLLLSFHPRSSALVRVPRILDADEGAFALRRERSIWPTSRLYPPDIVPDSFRVDEGAYAPRRQLKTTIHPRSSALARVPNQLDADERGRARTGVFHPRSSVLVRVPIPFHPYENANTLKPTPINPFHPRSSALVRVLNPSHPNEDAPTLKPTLTNPFHPHSSKSTSSNLVRVPSPGVSNA